MKKTSKAPKTTARTAKPKPAKRRAFPYQKVVVLWAEEKTIPEIAKAIGRVGKGDDPYHGIRVALTKMHKGYKDAKGNIVKLPHRVSRAALRAATEAGQRSRA